MSKLLIAFLLGFTQHAFAQSDIRITGFGDIHLGASYEELKDKLIEVDAIPNNAWFAPMSLEVYMEGMGGDSTGFAAQGDSDKIMAEEMGTKLIRCTLQGKQNSTFLGHRIGCAQLIFTDDLLSGITLVLDQSSITVKSKRQLLIDLEERLGESICSFSVNYNPKPFYCSWFPEEGGEFTISDMIVPGGGPGKTIHIVITL